MNPVQAESVASQRLKEFAVVLVYVYATDATLVAALVLVSATVWVVTFPRMWIVALMEAETITDTRSSKASVRVTVCVGAILLVLLELVSVAESTFVLDMRHAGFLVSVGVGTVLVELKMSVPV